MQDYFNEREQQWKNGKIQSKLSKNNSNFLISIFSYQFHFMRDLPNHNTEILGGLWGANVYMNISRTISMITDMYAMGPDGRRGADQIIIAKVIWPSAR